MNSLVECHLKNKLTKDDVVAIMWTNIARLDSYRNGSWHTPGNFIGKKIWCEETQNMFDVRGFYLRDLAFIFMANQLLESIGCEHYMFSMIDITDSRQSRSTKSLESDIPDVLPYYQTVLTKIRPSVHQTVFNYDWQSRPFQSITQKLQKFQDVKQQYDSVAGKDWPEFEKLWDNKYQNTIPRRIMKEIFNLKKWDWASMRNQYQRTDCHPTPLEHLEYLIKTLPEHEILPETVQMAKDATESLELEQEIENQLTQLCKRAPERW